MSDKKSNNYRSHVVCTLLSLLFISLYFLFKLNSYKVDAAGNFLIDFAMNVVRYFFFAVIIITSSNYSNWKGDNSYFWFLNIFNITSVFFVIYFIFEFNSSLNKIYDPFLTYFFIVASVFLGFNFTKLLKSIIPAKKLSDYKIYYCLSIFFIAFCVGCFLANFEGDNFNMISLIGGACLSALFPLLFSDENKME